MDLYAQWMPLQRPLALQNRMPGYSACLGTQSCSELGTVCMVHILWNAQAGLAADYQNFQCNLAK